MASLRRAARAVLAVGLLLACLAATQAPAAADTPVVVVTPDRVADGDRVDVDISGFPPGWSALVECSAAVVDAPDDMSALCRMLAGPYSGTPPAREQVTVDAAFTTLDGTGAVDCLTVTDGCVVGVVTFADESSAEVVAAAFAPITFVPTFTGTPRHQLADGDTVAVSGAGLAAGEWSIAQCARAVLDDPTTEQAAASCAAPLPITVGSDGVFAADLVVRDPLTSGSGTAVPWGYRGCVMVLSSAGEPAVTSFTVSFGPTRIRVEPADDVVDGSTVRVSVDGASADGQVRQCAAPVGSTWQDSRCGAESWTLAVDAWGSGSVDAEVRASLAVPGEARPVDCRAAGCALAVFDGAGALVGEAVPIGLAPPPELGLEPSTGLLDGQPMTVTASRLVPGREYRLQRCDTRACEEGVAVTASPAGTIGTTLTARRRLDITWAPPRLCRDDCVVALAPPGGGEPLARAGYAMATGSASVSPDTGLADGQEVQVGGRDLMPSYQGPTLGSFATGTWILTQCDAAVLDDLTLFGAFTHCSVAPPTRAVTVPSSTLDTTLAVRASIDRILGGTTDCTTGPAACVVGLVRFEQDASLSAHLVPVAFAPA